MKYFSYCLKHYADFTGRATRSEYWFYYLFFVIFYWLGLLVASTLDSQALEVARLMNQITIPVYSLIFQIAFWLAFLIPSLAVCCRRLHDVGSSGWFMLIVLVPVVGWIWLLVKLCSDSDPDSNEYGDNPKSSNQQMLKFSSPEVQENPLGNSSNNQVPEARIINVVNGVVSIGLKDGSFFDISSQELDFLPIIGESVFVYENGNAKIVTKEKLA